MAKHKGNGRAHICYPEKHTAGILKGGTLPSINNPNYEVRHQGEPTIAHPTRKRHQLAHIGRIGSEPK
jgi:hypothetical protein